MLGTQSTSDYKFFEFWNVCIDMYWLDSFNMEIFKGSKYEVVCLLASFEFQSISVLGVRDILYVTRYNSQN